MIEPHPLETIDEDVFQKAKGNGAGKRIQGDQKENPSNSIYSTWDDPVIPSRTVTPIYQQTCFLGGWVSMWTRFPRIRKPHRDWL